MLRAVTKLNLPSRKEVAADWKADGGRIAAVYPIHYPRELLRAFGVLPMEVWGPPGTRTASGDRHLQAYTCSIVRGGLSFLLDGGVDVADLIVVPHACDSLQGMGSMLIDFVDERRPVLTIYSPRGGSGVTRIDFLNRELAAVFEKLAEIVGEQPSAAALREAIDRETKADALLAQLLSSRRRIDLGERDFYRLVRSREYLPAEQFTRIVQGYLTEPLGELDDRPAVVISGLVPEPMGILDAIEEAGGRVVGDDMACSGRRLYGEGSSEDPLRRMAERLLSAPPDSTRGAEIQARADHLVALAAAGGAKAVLHFLVKFCEPELFYLPQMRPTLEAAGLRSIVIEADVCEPLPNQAVTRAQALVETLR
ncbi:MAG: hypothetical protein CME06_02420 [Gemmatimonadetes bacterium]|nr:hypothetical protein [Gemmatimonadota bacterium]